ncbi:MAG: hypothetical protein ABI440_05980 [Casimicrobiaceae bacterium]
MTAAHFCGDVIAPMLADRDFRIECRIVHLAGGAGVIFAVGDPIAGIALFARDDASHFVDNGGTGEPVAAAMALTGGTHGFRLDYAATSERKGETRARSKVSQPAPYSTCRRH